MSTETAAPRAHRTAQLAEGAVPRRLRRIEPDDTSPAVFAAFLQKTLPKGKVPFHSEAPAAASGAEGVMFGPDGERPVESAGLPQPLQNIEVPDSDLSKLDPEFRDRLERVMQRMEQEYGHRTQVVEALRPQERQDFLYEQGRSRPGPVVTWTQASKHTLGRAVDVLVDGTYDNPQGYARLAQVAQQEGLRTLGARDPGHLELVVDRAAPGALHNGLASGRVVQEPRFAFGVQGGQTGSIELVSIAPVAGVAEVARVASIAATAVRSVLARQSAPAEVTARNPVQLNGDAGEKEESQDGMDSSGENGRVVQMLSSLDLGGRAGLDSFAERLQLASGAGSVERAVRLLEIRHAEGLRSPSQVVLRLNDADGDPVLIRVGLRGNVVDTRIDLSSEAAVERMRTQIGDLMQALGRRGLDAEGLQVQLSRIVADIQELDATSATRTPAFAGDGKEGGFERERGHSGLTANDPRDRESRDRRDPHSAHDQERKERS